MARATRIANKTQWSLQDIIAAVTRGRHYLQALRDRNNTIMDPLFAVNLTNLIDVLSTIEVTAILAQSGEYRQEVMRK